MRGNTMQTTAVGEADSFPYKNECLRTTVLIGPLQNFPLPRKEAVRGGWIGGERFEGGLGGNQ